MKFWRCAIAEFVMVIDEHATSRVAESPVYMIAAGFLG